MLITDGNYCDLVIRNINHTDGHSLEYLLWVVIGNNYEALFSTIDM